MENRTTADEIFFNRHGEKMLDDGIAIESRGLFIQFLISLLTGVIEGNISSFRIAQGCFCRLENSLK